MSAPSNPADCYFCHKGPSIDHPVIQVTDTTGCERGFGIECLTLWQENTKGCCMRTTATYGWTKDRRVNPKLTQYGGFLYDMFEPPQWLTYLSKKRHWLIYNIIIVEGMLWREIHSQLVKVQTTIHDDQVPLGAYLPRGGRHIPLPSWDCGAPLVAIPEKRECLRCCQKMEKDKLKKDNLKKEDKLWEEKMEKRKMEMEKLEKKKKEKKEMKKMEKMEMKKMQKKK
jgi:hypothetical protein